MAGSHQEEENSATVDREAATAESTDEANTVPRDGGTVARPHLITLFYSVDTSKEIIDKLPKGRVKKQAGETIKLGRGENVDVMLNDSHMSKNFAELWCETNTDACEPKWFVKNVSTSKPVRVFINSTRTVLKTGEKKEVHDLTDIKMETLRFTARTEEGDLGDLKEFELEILPMDPLDSSSLSSGSMPRQSSTESSGSLTSAAGLHRQRAGSGRAANSSPSNVASGSHLGLPIQGYGQFPGVLPAQFTGAASSSGCSACGVHSGCPHHHPQGYYQHHQLQPCCMGHNQAPGSQGFPGQPYAASLNQQLQQGMPGVAAQQGPWIPQHPHSGGVVPPGHPYNGGGLGYPGSGNTFAPTQPAPGLAPRLPQDVRNMCPQPTAPLGMQAAALNRPYSGPVGQELSPGGSLVGNMFPKASGPTQVVPPANTPTPYDSRGQALNQNHSGQQDAYSSSGGTAFAELSQHSSSSYMYQQQQVQGQTGQITQPLPLRGPLSMPVSSLQVPQQNQRPSSYGGAASQQQLQGLSSQGGGQVSQQQHHQQHIAQQQQQQQYLAQQQQQQQQQQYQAFIAQPESAAGALNLQSLQQALPPRIISTPTSQDQNPQLYYEAGSLPVAPPVAQLQSLRFPTPVQVTTPDSMPNSGSGGWGAAEGGVYASPQHVLVSSDAERIVSGAGVLGGVSNTASEVFNAGTSRASYTNAGGRSVDAESLDTLTSVGQSTLEAALQSLQGLGGNHPAQPSSFSTQAPALSSLNQPADNGNQVNLRLHDGIAATPPASANFGGSLSSGVVEDLQQRFVAGQRRSPGRQPEETDDREPEEHDEDQQ